MRVVRVGDETSTVGADVRAALTSWGRGDSVVGGVAMVGVRPRGCDQQVDAIVVLPRGVLVVVGVDLPDPAVRLDAPLSGQWKTDGWPLVRTDGAVNPAVDAAATVGAIRHTLEQANVEPLPVGTVVAVGPYVSQVHQPTSDLLRGVRILHPEPKTLLTAARELATAQRPCTVTQARAILTALAPDSLNPDHVDLSGEGFTDSPVPTMAAASTTLIPRVQLTEARPAPAKLTKAASRAPVRWLPGSAVVLVALLLLTGIVYAVASSSSSDAPPTGTAAVGGETTGVTINGVKFEPMGAVSDTDCAAHAYGDVQVWLQRNRCSELVRARYESTSDGKRAAILVAVLRFPESVLAGELNTVAERPGSGAIADASTEGTPWPGKSKPFFESAAFASGREGNSLKLVQAVWIGAPSTPDDDTLRKLATSALQIPSPA